METNPGNPVGFGQDELIVCGSCSRANPPNRLECIYCGEALELNEEQKQALQPVVSTAEAWEPAVSIVLVAKPEPEGTEALTEASKMLSLEREVLGAITEARPPLPLVRTAALAEAELVCERLRALGFNVLAIQDRDLAPEAPPVRLRSVSFGKESISAVPFNPGSVEVVRFTPGLIVRGTIVRRELRSTEGRSRGRGRLLETTEMGADEAVVDVYPVDDARGFRIRRDGFDFSCLGSGRALTANENMGLLVEVFNQRFPECEVAEDFRSLRAMLSAVWPPSEMSSSEGVERKSFGGFAKRKMVVTDNEEQFTRYSRMIRYLKFNESISGRGSTS